jgi:hypothetical protein
MANLQAVIDAWAGLGDSAVQCHRIGQAASDTSNL